MSGKFFIQCEIFSLLDRPNVEFLDFKGGYKKFEKQSPQKIISLCLIKEIKNIEERDDGVFIGAGVTYTELVSGLKRFHGIAAFKALEVLGTAVENIATVQLRNVARLIGGILWNQPASDLLPILSVAKAVLKVRSPDGVIFRMPVDKRNREKSIIHNS